jgi:hypothetical protein
VDPGMMIRIWDLGWKNTGFSIVFDLFKAKFIDFIINGLDFIRNSMLLGMFYSIDYFIGC